MTRRLSTLIILGGTFLMVTWNVWAAPTEEAIIEQSPRFISGGKGKEPFDVTRHTIPMSEILGGGPPRDAIPALNDPTFISKDQADRLLRKHDRVLGVILNGEAKAYPVAILNWHELVNDRVGGRAVLVSW